MKHHTSEFDQNYLKRMLSLSPKQRLECLEQLNEFLMKVMPQKSKDIWEKLKKKGY